MANKDDSSSTLQPTTALNSNDRIPFLPYDILYLIVQLCPVSTYLTYTRVNTTFRRIVYSLLTHKLTTEYIPPYNLSDDLVVHLLNNQKLPGAREDRVWAPYIAAGGYWRMIWLERGFIPNRLVGEGEEFLSVFHKRKPGVKIPPETPWGLTWNFYYC